MERPSRVRRADHGTCVGGLAWMTGGSSTRIIPECRTRASRPIAGIHAAFACLLALEPPRATGEGQASRGPPWCEGSPAWAAAQSWINVPQTGRLLHAAGNRRTPRLRPQCCIVL